MAIENDLSRAKILSDVIVLPCWARASRVTLGAAMMHMTIVEGPLRVLSNISRPIAAMVNAVLCARSPRMLVVEGRKSDCNSKLQQTLPRAGRLHGQVPTWQESLHRLSLPVVGGLAAHRKLDMVLKCR
jgi:hypothetical protein